MGPAELKFNIHQIVDSIQNEQLLQTLYDFLRTRKTSQPGRLKKEMKIFLTKRAEKNYHNIKSYIIKGERIIILTFFDVRQDPKKKPR